MIDHIKLQLPRQRRRLRSAAKGARKIWDSWIVCDSLRYRGWI